ncbi:MAG: DUF4198 domain-containing protein [Acidobacteria bacterium]|nr:DUF4198 domain-containing protein [Acidobacteriota bacterium]
MPNFIELPAAKFDEYLAHEHLTAVQEERNRLNEAGKPGRELYSKYVKAILHTGAPNDFVTKPIGQVIEFVPAVDPSSLRPGQLLPLQVFFRGAPIANTHVEASSASGTKVLHRQLGRTDSQGRISVPLDVPGLWKLHAIHMERHGDRARADWESFWASMTFEVSP